MSTISQLYMAELFGGCDNISYSCLAIMNGWRLTKSVLYFIQYVTLKCNCIEYHSFKYWCIFFIWQLFVFQYKITSIKSDTFNSITKLDQLSIFFFILLTFYDLQYMYIYSLCCLRTIYTHNIQIPGQTKLTFIIIIKHTSKV